MRYRFSVLGSVFFALALVFAACEFWGVWEFFHDTGRTLTYVGIGSCAIAAVTPALPGLADWAHNARMRAMCFGMWLAFGLCLVIVITAAVQRTGAAADGAAQAVVGAQRATALAETTERELSSAYDRAQSEAERECAQKNGGRGKKCLDAEAKAGELRGQLAAARMVLVRAPAGVQRDPLVVRIAAITHLSEDRVRLLWPLWLPAALSLLSALCFAGWLRIDFTFTAPSTPLPAPSIVQAAAVARPRAVGAVAEFMTDVFEAGDGSTDATAIHNAYGSWCARGDRAPLSDAQFADELARICREIGVSLVARDGSIHAEKIRLVAA